MITFVTIVKDGMPFISYHYPVFRNLKLAWRWIVIEGTAAATHCTSWCADQPAGVSSDGTHELLRTLSKVDRRVTHIHSCARWDGKVCMFNTALQQIAEPCLLWEVDADEIWTSAQIERAFYMLKWPDSKYDSMKFFCRYFIGPDIVIVGRNCYGNHTAYEWLRVWQWRPGMKFITHEPPNLSGCGNPMPQIESSRAALEFDHYAWVLEEQVARKCAYYAGTKNPLGHLYTAGVDGWRRLQENNKWPARVGDYLPWVQDNSMCTRLPHA